MQTAPLESKLESKLERIGKVLRVTAWSSLSLQIGFGAVSALMLLFASAGRNFSQANVVQPTGIPGVAVPIGQSSAGLGVGIFWAVCGILALLAGIYLSYRQTRLARRLRHADTMRHPSKSEVMTVLRWGAIVGVVGLLLMIIGGGTTLGFLFSKAIAQPRGVAIYNPSLTVRDIDIMVAMANMSGITAHFAGAVASAGVFEWLHR
ncbi:MAG: DUF3611 family protein [Chamaesiphon sp.]|nr:DUF3611 family protein [Chamaesiphon sp.]